MAWTAILVDPVKRDERWVFTIVYTNGREKVAREYASENLDDDIVKRFARAGVASLDVAEAAVGKLTIGSGDEIDLEEPVLREPERSTADLAREEIANDIALLARYARAVDLGLLDAADKRIAVLHEKILAAWSDDYLDLV